MPNQSVAILRYHAVANNKKNDYASESITITTDNFERHVRYLSKRYNIINLDEVYTCIRNKKSFKPNSVVFTFDDGYADNFNAYKILKKYNCTGTFYITAECINWNTPLWLIELRFLINHTSKKDISVSLNSRTYSFSLKDHREDAIQKLTILIKSNDLKTRENIMKQIRTQLDDVQNYSENLKHTMLSWKQVKTMHKDGMTIAAHTKTHCNLPNAKEDEAKEEITGSKRLIEQNLSTKVKHFSYPNSGPYPYYTEQIKSMVKEAGFLTATTSAQGFAGTDSDLYELKRVRTPDSLPELISLMEWDRFTEKIKSFAFIGKLITLFS